MKIWKLIKKNAIASACMFIPQLGLRGAIKRGRMDYYKTAQELLSAERAGKLKFKDEVAIIGMFRDQAEYLPEWIEYHRIMGVSKFYLANNESSDNPEKVLKPYIDSGIVVLKNVSDRDCEKLRKKYWGGQKRIAVHWMMHHLCRKTAKWVMVIDPDEFIQPKKHKNIPDFLNSLAPDTTQVIVGWQIFGSNGHIKKPKGLITENFTRRGKIKASKCGKIKATRQFKAIVNPRAIVTDLNHYHEVIGETVDETGKKLRSRIYSYPAPANIIACNHYVTRSRNECIAKVAHNKTVGNTGGRYDQKNAAEIYFETYDRNEILDESMLKYVPEIKKALGIRD
ncbi:MAG: glycosyltransferase family 92 protein [Alphaproteobacteria bacterium]|nr:glycosyltransferase family 92 protein [Alphaproteobacteria bacterium]